MGCKLECGLVTLCHGGSRGPFWPKHVVANMFMPQDSAFRHPHCEKCGLVITQRHHGRNAASPGAREPALRATPQASKPAAPRQMSAHSWQRYKSGAAT